MRLLLRLSNYSSRGAYPNRIAFNALGRLPTMDVVVSSICRMKIQRPLFVDLFFAVVIGAGFQRITFNLGQEQILLHVFLLAVILEDWYSYYNYVVPHSADTGKSAKALTLEFLILLSWYLAIAAVGVHHHAYSLAFGTYFLWRVVAGIKHYGLRKGDGFAQLDRDWWLILPMAAGFLTYDAPQTARYLITASAWIIFVVAWHGSAHAARGNSATGS